MSAVEAEQRILAVGVFGTLRTDQPLKIHWLVQNFFDLIFILSIIIIIIVKF
jgi:hypothetical protein